MSCPFDTDGDGNCGRRFCCFCRPSSMPTYSYATPWAGQEPYTPPINHAPPKSTKIRTFSGGWIDPLSIDPEDVKIADIAHGLSNEARYAGQSLYFYSVGQHSVLMRRHAKKMGYGRAVQLECLLHDAFEAYAKDIPAPIKSALGGYSTYEYLGLRTIYRRFGLSVDTTGPGAIKAFDEAIRSVETRALFPKHLSTIRSVVPAEWSYLEIEKWGPPYVEETYIKDFLEVI